jgi:hypothetical protein
METVMDENKVVEGTKELGGFYAVGYCIWILFIAVSVSQFLTGCEYRTAIEWHGQTGIDNTTATKLTKEVRK